MLVSLQIRLSRTIVRDQDFEWNDRKAAANLHKHGVSFEVARDAFDDAFAVEIEDRRERYGEERYVLLGMVRDRLLAVTYTLRDDRIRIISARPAEAFERRLYHEKHREA
jgi:uncharacterized DUF497 family protein